MSHEEISTRDLQGRVALVTGASRGIGAATARALAAAGARVIATDVADTSEVAAEIGGLSRRLDVTSEEDWVETVAFAKAAAGGLDILVNNAGIFHMKPLTDTTLEEWRRVHRVNVEGVFLGCKHAIPQLAERAGQWSGGGAIVNISSVGGMIAAGNDANYCASKGAVRLLTKSLAIELAPRNIRVNSVHPGVTETAMIDEAITILSDSLGVDKEEGRRRVAAWNPLGRTADPSNIADGVVFLASGKSAFMTGAELVIDGGMTAQ